MTDSDIQFYRDNGYLIVKNAIPFSNLLELYKDIFQILVQQLSFLDIQVEGDPSLENIFKAMKQLHQIDINRYLASLRLCAKTTSLYQCVTHKNILETAKKLGIELPVFQTQPVFHVMAEELRFKDGYFGVGAHQDWPALQSGLDTITTWVPLVPVKKNYFSLDVLPESHLLGFCKSTETQHYHEIEPQIYQGLNFTTVELNPGDVLFFSVFTIHKSETQGEPGAFRLAYSMRYENASNDYFIKKSYPFAQKRVVERSLDENDIPNKSDVTKLFSTN